MMYEPIVKLPRLSRIINHHDKLFQYPLHIANTLSNLRLRGNLLMVVSSARAKMKARGARRLLPAMGAKPFRNRLYRTFFEAYTEKVRPPTATACIATTTKTTLMFAGHRAALTLCCSKDVDPCEVNAERSDYEEQVLTPDSKHQGTYILTVDKTTPHETV
jgi:hypothetical protein